MCHTRHTEHNSCYLSHTTRREWGVEHPCFVFHFHLSPFTPFRFICIFLLLFSWLPFETLAITLVMLNARMRWLHFTGSMTMFRMEGESETNEIDIWGGKRCAHTHTRWWRLSMGCEWLWQNILRFAFGKWNASVNDSPVAAHLYANQNWQQSKDRSQSRLLFVHRYR